MRLKVALVLGLMLAVVAPTPAAGEAQEQTTGKVLILSLPTLTWQDVRENDLPALERLLAESATGSLSVRAIGARTDPDEGYATVGAGNRARGALEEGGYAADANEALTEGRAADAYQRRVGAPPDGDVLHLGLPPLFRANRALRYGARVGALGSALRDAGRRAAVVANADTGASSLINDGLYRPAAAAVMDREGRIAAGTVSPEILTADPAAPFGFRLDIEKVRAAAAAAWGEADVLLVEASDLLRAAAWRPLASASAAREARRAALHNADRVVRATIALAGPRDLVIVISPFAGVRERLTVAAARGPGMRDGALLRSPSTRRAGYVTLPDIAPTVLDHLGIDRPTSMTGRAMQSTGGTAALADRTRQLADADESARFRDTWQTPFLVLYIVLHSVLFLVAIALYWRRSRRPQARWLRFAALVLLALPVTTYLLGALPVWRWGPGTLFGLIAAIAVALAALSLLASRLALGPPMVLAAFSAAVLVLDVVTGGRLQIDTLFGYSPIVAGRFQGFGNTAFSVLAVCTLLVATWLVCLGGATRRVRLAMAALFVVALVADGAPQFGSDVGGILTTVPAYGLAFLLLSGRRLNWRILVGVFAAAAVVLGIAIAIDLSRPESERTHLARLVETTEGDGASSLLTVIERKAAANVGVLASSLFTYLVPFLIAFLAVLLWRPPALMADIVDRYPSLRPGMVAILVAAVVGFAVNDSGVAVPAVMLAILETVLLYAVTTLPDERRSAGDVVG